jgi:hypothetical protein
MKRGIEKYSNPKKNGELNDKIKELEKRPTAENYQKSKDNQKPLNLPSD